MLRAVLLALLIGCAGGALTLRPPTDVTATPGPGWIEVSWRDTSDGEAGFAVYRAPATGDDVPAFERIASTEADATRYRDASVAPGTAYRYRVAAVGDGGRESEPAEQGGEPATPLRAVTLELVVAGAGSVEGPDGLVCRDRCTLTVAPDVEIAFEAVADDGVAFAGWTGLCDGVDARCSAAPAGDARLEAAFARDALRLELEGDGDGTVTVFRPDREDVVCRDDCVVVFEDVPSGGIATTLTIDAPSVTRLGAWSGACEGAEDVRFCLVTVDGPVTVGKLWLRPPVAEDDAFSTAEDTPLEPDPSRNVLANDVDSEGDTLRAVLVAPPERGELELAPDGTFRFVPAADAFGEESFVYRVEDAYGNVSGDTGVTLRVRPVDDAPVAEDLELATDEDTPVALTLRGSDVDGDELSFELVEDSGPEHGSVRGTPPELTYTPAADFAGEDAFRYVARAGDARSEPATVRVSVAAAPDPPVAVADAYRVDEDGSLRIDAADGVLANDSDADDDELVAELVEDVEHGSLELAADGSFRYVPDEDFDRTDRFRYRASDGSEVSAPVEVELRVDPINDPPVARGAAVRVAEDGELTITLGGSDVDSADDGRLRYRIVDAPEHGAIRGASGDRGDDRVVYAPDRDFFGEDDLVFEVRDDAGTRDRATVTITVDPVDDPPTAEDVEVGVRLGQRIEIRLRGSDVEGDALRYEIRSFPRQGYLDEDSRTDGDDRVAYTSVFDNEATDAFTYVVVAGGKTSAAATVTIRIERGGPPPGTPPGDDGDDDDDGGDDDDDDDDDDGDATGADAPPR